MIYTNLTLGELLSSDNSAIKRNATGILKQLQKEKDKTKNKKYLVWLKENEEQLEEDYDFDLTEAIRLKDTADYGNDNWQHLLTFERYCLKRYEMMLEDKKTA